MSWNSNLSRLTPESILTTTSLARVGKMGTKSTFKCVTLQKEKYLWRMWLYSLFVKIRKMRPALILVLSEAENLPFAFVSSISVFVLVHQVTRVYMLKVREKQKNRIGVFCYIYIEIKTSGFYGKNIYVFYIVCICIVICRGIVCEKGLLQHCRGFYY